MPEGKKKVVIRILVITGIIIIATIGYQIYIKMQDQNLKAEGSVEATEVMVGSEVSGIADEVLFEEGMEVKKGQALVRIDPTSLNLASQQSEAQLANLQAQLAELKRGSRQEEIQQAEGTVQQATGVLKKAQANLANTEKNYQRMQKLLADGGISQAAFDQQSALYEQAQGDVTSAAGSLESARERLKQLRNGATKETIAALEAKVTEAEARLSASNESLGKTVITATANGTVSSRLIDAGELVHQNMNIAAISDMKHLYINGYIPAKKMGQIKLNAPAYILADAWPDKYFTGKITRIATEAEFTPMNKQTGEDRADLVFEVRIDINDANGQLLAGMPADIYFKKP